MNATGYMVRQILKFVRDIGAGTVVVEDRTGYAPHLRSLGLRARELSRFEVKEHFLPVAGSPTNRAICKAMTSLHPSLERFGRDKRTGTRSFGEPDRWRTVVLLAVAFFIAAQEKKPNSQLL
jgi:hypothetical protein